MKFDKPVLTLPFSEGFINSSKLFVILKSLFTFAEIKKQIITKKNRFNFSTPNVNYTIDQKTFFTN